MINPNYEKRMYATVTSDTTCRLDNGETIHIVDFANRKLKVGQRVRPVVRFSIMLDTYVAKLKG